MRRLHVAALGILLAACSGASPSTTIPPVTTPSTPALSIPPAEPTAKLSPTPAATNSWRLVSIPPIVGEWSMPVAIVAANSGFVAVGGREFRDPTVPAGGIAGAWRSDDGLTWEPASPDGLAVGELLPEGGPEPGLVDVAWGTGGFVAVGYAAADGEPRLDGGAWHSADGRAWARSGSSVWERARPTAVTWSGTHYVVVGVVEEEAAPRAAIWYSADGLAWTRAPDGPAFDVGTYMDTLEAHAWGGPQAVAANDDGVLYTIGRTCREGATWGNAVCQELAWRSLDARTWAREDLGKASADAFLVSIAAIGDRVIAVGESGREDPSTSEGRARVLVRTPDGWTSFEPSGIPRLAHAVPLGTGFLVASGTRLWTSVSGETWTPIVGSPTVNVRAFDVTQAGAQIVGVGWTGQPGGFAVIWSAPAAG